MTTFTEILPARKSSKHSAINWTPEIGMLDILTDRDATTYRVKEFGSSWDGIALRFEKASPGSDSEETAYDVFCGRNRQDFNCSCKGFMRFSHCKHVDSGYALIDNGWLAPELANPEQDVQNTERDNFDAHLDRLAELSAFIDREIAAA